MSTGTQTISPTAKKNLYRGLGMGITAAVVAWAGLDTSVGGMVSGIVGSVAPPNLAEPLIYGVVVGAMSLVYFFFLDDKVVKFFQK